MLEELLNRGRAWADEDPQTISFAAFCGEWLAGNGGLAVPRLTSMRTVNTTWLYFATPDALVYKVGGWGRPKRATVDLYLRELGYEGDLTPAVCDLYRLPRLDGFVPDVDTKGNALMRFSCAAPWQPFGRRSC